MTDYRSIRMSSTCFGWALTGAILLAAPTLALPPSGAPFPSGSAQLNDDSGTGDGAPIADERASYSYLRTLEGSATVAAAGKGLGEALETNQPLLTGDLIRVDSDSRLELRLSDRNRLFLGADSSLILERIAFSGDREERITELRLESGELILEVSEEALGDELPRVITTNTTVYLQEPGLYRIETGVGSDGDGWTRVLTRRGYAEIVTDRGSSLVRAEESVVALGDRATNLELSAADGADALERWTGALTDRAARATRSARNVEPQLAYDAAPLEESGNWIEVENVHYWRPYVSSGWRPYWQGRWDWTPSGYTWISYEPWGWVPYHYGRWCSLPGYGWAWRPGAVYSPAWVYWNWTSGYAGWVPMGYYSHFYNPWYNGGFRYGVYGWAGGGWGLYSDWNFAPVHCFRDRRFRGEMRRGHDMERHSGHREPPRGLLTTDTRDLRPERLDRTDRTDDLLREIGKRHQPRTGADLPDMTDFVGRKGRLPNDVASVVVAPTGRGREVIRDIDRAPRVAEAPVWRQKEVSREEKTDRSAGHSGDKELPVFGSGADSKENPGRTTGLVLDRPRTQKPSGISRGTSQVDSQRATATQGTAGPGTQAGGKSSIGGTRGTGVTGRAGGSGAAGASGKGEGSAQGATDKADTPRVVSRVPVAKVQEPASPSRPSSSTLGSSPVTQNRQLWKERGGESTPVQRVVGSVRRPSPGGDRGNTGAASPGGRPAGSAAPYSYDDNRAPAPSSAQDPRAQGTAIQRAPAATQRQEPTLRQQPQQRTPASPPSVRSRPSQPSEPSQPAQRAVTPPPAVRSRPTQPAPQPAVRSQPDKRTGASQPSPSAPPVVRSQPSAKSSSSSQPAAKSQSSGSKGGHRSSQSPPPPPEKKGDGHRG